MKNIDEKGGIFVHFNKRWKGGPKVKLPLSRRRFAWNGHIVGFVAQVGRREEWKSLILREDNGNDGIGDGLWVSSFQHTLIRAGSRCCQGRMWWIAMVQKGETEFRLFSR